VILSTVREVIERSRMWDSKRETVGIRGRKKRPKGKLDVVKKNPGKEPNEVRSLVLHKGNARGPSEESDFHKKELLDKTVPKKLRVGKREGGGREMLKNEGINLSKRRYAAGRSPR